jgi:hypothetical protein
MRHRLIRRLPAALLAGGAVLFAATAIWAATAPSITLVLHGGTNQQFAACKDPLHHWLAYKIGTTIQMDGYITPEPSGTWHAKIKVKKCTLGRWVTIWARDEVGHGTVVGGVTEGHFQGSYKPARTGLYRVKAEYTPLGATKPTLVTEYQHFHIHR